MPVQLAARQSSVLEAIIREYIRTAEPVGSFAVMERYDIAASPATIRNDMADLEDDGFIHQPHTSAGRVPTEKAYQYYVDNFLRDVDVPRQEEKALRQIWSMNEMPREILKLTAKMVASFSTESVFLAFDKHDVYYTGLANLFSQPEFVDQGQVQSVSAMIDRLDEAVADIYSFIPHLPRIPRHRVAGMSGSEKILPAWSNTTLEGAGFIHNEVQVFIGQKHGFGRRCSVIVTTYEMPGAGAGLGIFGLLGPTRMDYDLNMARLKYVHSGVSSQNG